MIFKICETSLNIQNGGAHSTNENIQLFLNSTPILIKFVSKFMVCKVHHFEAQYALRLRSPLNMRYHDLFRVAVQYSQSCPKNVIDDRHHRVVWSGAEFLSHEISKIALN